MGFQNRFGFLAALLAVEAMIIYSNDRVVGAIIALVFALLATIRHSKATSLLDLFDRSTVFFGLIAGLPFGMQLARDLDHGLGWRPAVWSPAALMFALVLTVSFWARAKLISKSQRKGYLR